jgi:hypothetical protein
MAQESHTVEWIAFGVAMAFFGLFGVVVLVAGVKDAWWGLVSPGWPRVLTEVVRSEVTLESSRDSDGTTSVTHRPEVLFAYEVDGESYITGTIRFGQSEGSRDPSEAEMLRLRYPVGARATVSHQPGNPARAVVKPGFQTSALGAVGGGIGMLLGGVFIFLTARVMLSNASMGQVLILFVVVFILIGLILGGLGAGNLKDAWASRTWPVALGEIVFQEGQRIESRSTDADGRTHVSSTFATSIIYAFVVDGVTHYANARRIGQIAGAGKGWAAEIAERYPVGAAVEVRFKPEDPDRAVLEPGFSSEILWLPGAGLAFLLFGLAALIWGIPALTKG